MILACDNLPTLSSVCSAVLIGRTQLFETMKRDGAGSLGNVLNATRLRRQTPPRHRPRLSEHEVLDAAGAAFSSLILTGKRAVSRSPVLLPMKTAIKIADLVEQSICIIP
jgi:hypothetical protein